MTKEQIKTEQILEKAIDCIKDKKGEKISLIKFPPEEGAVWDYFIICQANNNIHAQAISDHIQLSLKNDLKTRADHTEGYQNAKWVLIDYFDIVIHIFLPETREFYNLEKLWADAQITKFN